MKSEAVKVSTGQFCAEVTQFCGILREQLMSRWEEFEDLHISSGAALEFSENLMLCPTIEAGRVCIQKDIPGALSMLFAVQGIQQRIEKGRAELPEASPDSQTTFFLLACAVQDYLASVMAPAGN